MLSLGLPAIPDWEKGNVSNDDDVQEWYTQLVKLKGVTKYGFQIHFSLSDILASYPVMRAPEHPLSNHCVLQSCTGTFIEAILLLVRCYSPFLTYLPLIVSIIFLGNWVD